MKLKKFCCNKTIIKNDMKMVGFLGIFYTILLIFLMPVNILEEINYDLLYNKTSYARMYFSDEFIFLCFIVPVVIAIILFRYIQDTRSVSKLHSLPFTRNQLYNSHIISGLIILAGPVLINGAILIVGLIGKGYTQYIAVGDVLLFCGQFILSQLVVYLATIMVGMMVGSSILNIIVTYILLGLPFGLAGLMSMILQSLLYGYPYGRDISEIWYKLSPFTGIEYFEYSDHLDATLIFIAYCIVFYSLGMVLYNARNLERSNEIICFDWIKYVFIFGASFCSMLLVGTILQDAYGAGFGYRYNSEPLWTYYLGATIGALIGYAIATMLAYKTLKVYKYYKGLGAFALFAIILFTCINLDIMGYETKIPKAEDVEFIVYYNDNGYYGSNATYVLENATQDNEFLGDKYDYCGYNTYEEGENIKTILDIHQSVIDAKDNLNYLNYNEIMLLYKLRNGSNVFRRYLVDPNIFYDEMKEVYESDEFAMKNNEIFKNNDDYIITIELDNRINEKSINITDEMEIDQLAALIKEDIKGLTYEEHLNQDAMFQIVLNYKDEARAEIEGKSEFYSDSYLIKPAYRKTIEYLKFLGYYEDIVVSAEEVESILVFNSSNRYKNAEDLYLNDDYTKMYEKDDIMDVLKNISYGNYWSYTNENREQYSADGGLDVFIRFEDGHIEEGYIAEDNIYEGVKGYVNSY